MPPKPKKSEQRRLPTEAQLKLLGVNIRRERINRGMTQDQLAEQADLASRNIQRIEAGELNILVTTLCRLQRALGCFWEDLLG